MSFDPNIPPSILDLQQWFGKMVVRPLRETTDYGLPVYDSASIEAIQKRIVDGPRLTASQRIGIYNQQYWFRMFLILQDQYPCLSRLFGFQDFNYLIAEPYLLKYVPDHWDLGLLGRKLPEWIEETYQEEDRSLILEIARIDAAYERLFRVRALPSLKKSVLASPLKKPIFLQPFVFLFELDADLFSFRQELVSEEPEYWIAQDFPLIDWSKKRRYALYLEDNTPIHEEISEGEGILLAAFQKGMLLDEACSLLEGKIEDEEKISRWFYSWAAKGWLRDC